MIAVLFKAALGGCSAGEIQFSDVRKFFTIVVVQIKFIIFTVSAYLHISGSGEP